MSGTTSRGRSRLLTAAVAAGALALTGLSSLVASGASAAGTSTTGATTYLVVLSQGSSVSAATKAVSAAGGRVVTSWSSISVVVASSTSSSFAQTMRTTSGVEGVSATAKFATRLDDGSDAGTAQSTTDAAPTAPTGDTLSGLQWDMDQIKAPAAHAVTTGDQSVLVGDIDTGLDYTHPDLAANVDDSASVNCVSGAPVPGKVAAMDDDGHGTHTAGTIAAAANGIGIVGVAPSVRIAGIKAGDANGFFFPEAVVCAFMWAGDHGVDVTNNSYFADPWLFNCKNDPDQRAIWTAERRALKYAQTKGVLVVAAEGNQFEDLSHPTLDQTSPDDTNPVVRTVTNACAVFPTEAPGVIGVTATGNLRQKSYYSSFGISTADLAAPGGDRRLQVTAAAPNGRVLSTYPASLMGGCGFPVVDPSGATYCYLQGTSMAAPHVAGVAALIASVSQKRGGPLSAALQRAVNPIACPADVSAYAPFPGLDSGAPQTCQGGIGQNSWYGAGEVDAVKAVG
ncbi:S8 family serine peptidase [Intrasporangium sp. YIM S08009]|uniref:S8 family serine peptidase n=1 Tax=Intrasporangium zincisolvens TaxID=3080018 RepID=UPI002B0605BC|nr:S8 family serine peptidase [Intrasporangium sp. YIM S08009]